MDRVTVSRHRRRTPRLRFGFPALFSLLVVLVAGAALWFGRSFDFKTGLFPWAVAAVVLALAVLQFGLDCAGRGGAPASSDPDDDATPPPDIVRHRTAVIFGWIAGFFVAIWLLGFATGSALATFLQLKLGFRERWPVSIALTLLVWGFVHVFFERILNTPFPPGRLFAWLGIASGAD